jgi:dsDNA-specific endonuclease/ATPase MutS2
MSEEIESGIKNLERRKKELEEEFDTIGRKAKQGEISETDYTAERKRIEREFVEVMDRLTQYRFQGSGFTG